MLLLFFPYELVSINKKGNTFLNMCVEHEKKNTHINNMALFFVEKYELLILYSDILFKSKGLFIYLLFFYNTKFKHKNSGKGHSRIHYM